MAKRIGVFVTIVLMIVPVLAISLTLGGLFLAGTGPSEEAYEVFGKQNIRSTGILLADTGGNAFMVCVLEEGSTQLISILPTATPKEGQNTTFLSIYQKEGIDRLKQEIAKSLSLKVDGYLEVDFSGLSSVADALDGVAMEGRTYSGQELEGYFQSPTTDQTTATAQQDVVLAVADAFAAPAFGKDRRPFENL
jgi:anionic cell wall polymer biosynthesis LytR-Cps2A-Psr (LCP) family protein